MHGFYSRAELERIANQVLGERLDGRPKQGIDEENATPNYELGTRLLVGDKSFRYCKASVNGCERSYWGAQNRNMYNTDNLHDNWDGTPSGAQPVGSKTIVIPDTNSDHGVDHFAGGYVLMIVETFKLQMAKIVSSTPGGTSVTLTLRDPLTIALAATDSISVRPSIYSKVERVHGGGSPKAAIVAVPTIIVPGSHYFWGQTWGPCWATWSEANPGTASYERTLVWNHDGSVKLVVAHATPDGQHQLAGWLLQEFGDVADAFGCYFMLTILP